MNQTWENDKKPSFESDFGPFSPNLSVARYHGQLSSCTISEKASDPILRNLSDAATDGRTDGRTRVIS